MLQFETYQVLLLQCWMFCDYRSLISCLQGYFAEQDEGATPQAPLDPEQVEEKVAFALGDGRVGVLAVKGRKVPFPPLDTVVNGWMDDVRNQSIKC